jgi:N-acetylglutamate synthase-like GNAT family acetyltransferase
VDFIIRKALMAERQAIQNLIAVSARELSRNDYSDVEIEAALRAIFGVDTSLIQDGTYFVAEHNGQLIGCGGWSRRKTLFGGDQYSARDTTELNPKTDAARIRAFFIHPEFARKGVGRSILARCESEAGEHGFRKLELMSTLPGINFYEACGYERVQPTTLELSDATIGFVVMRKAII